MDFARPLFIPQNPSSDNPVFAVFPGRKDFSGRINGQGPAAGAPGRPEAVRARPSTHIRRIA